MSLFVYDLDDPQGSEARILRAQQESDPHYTGRSHVVMVQDQTAAILPWIRENFLPWAEHTHTNLPIRTLSDSDVMKTVQTILDTTIALRLSPDVTANKKAQTWLNDIGFQQALVMIAALVPGTRKHDPRHAGTHAVASAMRVSAEPKTDFAQVFAALCHDLREDCKGRNLDSDRLVSIGIEKAWSATNNEISRQSLPNHNSAWIQLCLDLLSHPLCFIAPPNESKEAEHKRRKDRVIYANSVNAKLPPDMAVIRLHERLSSVVGDMFRTVAGELDVKCLRSAIAHDAIKILDAQHLAVSDDSKATIKIVLAVLNKKLVQMEMRETCAKDYTLYGPEQRCNGTGIIVRHPPQRKDKRTTTSLPFPLLKSALA